MSPKTTVFGTSFGSSVTGRERVKKASLYLSRNNVPTHGPTTEFRDVRLLALFFVRLLRDGRVRLDDHCSVVTLDANPPPTTGVN
jgi:hypothetical protein